MQQDQEIFSLCFPNIVTESDILELFYLLKTRSNKFEIVESYSGTICPDNTENYTSLGLRYKLSEETESWAVLTANLEYFSPNRQSPFTVLMFRPNSIKNNPTTPQNQVGLDDIHLPLKRKQFDKVMEKTETQVPKNRGSIERKHFRARVTAPFKTKLIEEIKQLYI